MDRRDFDGIAFTRKKAVIVGGASDMAQAVNRIFLEEGADLFLINVNVTALREFKSSEPE